MIHKLLRTSQTAVDFVHTDDLSDDSLKELSNWMVDNKLPPSILLEKGRSCYYVRLWGQYSLDPHSRAEAQVKKIQKEWEK